MPLNFLWIIHSEVGDKNFDLFILRPRILPGVLQGFTCPEEGRGKRGRNEQLLAGSDGYGDPVESLRDIAACFLCIQLPFNCPLPLFGNESDQPDSTLCL